MKFLNLVLMMVLGLLLGSCSSDDSSSMSPEEYIAQNNLVTAQKLDEGVYIVFETKGEGKKPTVQDNVNINYKGYLTNGSVFDQGNDKTFPLSGLIKGWQIGIVEMPVGSTAKLIIPSSAGYGSRATRSIPANSTLVFDIDLLGIK